MKHHFLQYLAQLLRMRKKSWLVIFQRGPGGVSMFCGYSVFWYSVFCYSVFCYSVFWYILSILYSVFWYSVFWYSVFWCSVFWYSVFWYLLSILVLSIMVLTQYSGTQYPGTQYAEPFVELDGLESAGLSAGDGSHLDQRISPGQETGESRRRSRNPPGGGCSRMTIFGNLASRLQNAVKWPTEYIRQDSPFGPCRLSPINFKSGFLPISAWFARIRGVAVRVWAKKRESTPGQFQLESVLFFSFRRRCCRILVRFLWDRMLEFAANSLRCGQVICFPQDLLLELAGYQPKRNYWTHPVHKTPAGSDLQQNTVPLQDRHFSCQAQWKHVPKAKSAKCETRNPRKYGGEWNHRPWRQNLTCPKQKQKEVYIQKRCFEQREFTLKIMLLI